MLSVRDTPQNESYTQTKSKQMKKRYFMQMEMKREARVAILISDKTDFRTKAIKKTKKDITKC